MVNYRQAPRGKRWVLTEYGLENSKVRRTFTDSKERYEGSCPIQWVAKGYVELVDGR